MNKFAIAILAMAVLISFGASATSAGQLELQALKLVEKKSWPKVIDLLNPNTDVASPRSFLALATAYHEQNDFVNLVRILKLLSEKRPKDFYIQYMLGDAELKLARITKEVAIRQDTESEAVNSFRNSLKIKRDFWPTHQALVNYFSSVGMNHDAREQLTDMIRVFGQKGSIFSDLCRMYSIDGFLSQAIKHCNKAIQLSDKDFQSYLYLAQTYFDQKNMELAEKSLVSAAHKFPNEEFVQYGAGQFFVRNGNYPVATKYFRKAVANRPGSGRAQIGLAVALFESGLTAEALDHYIRACKVDNSHQTEFLAAASKLRLKADAQFSAKYSQAANACKR